MELERNKRKKRKDIILKRFKRDLLVLLHGRGGQSSRPFSENAEQSPLTKSERGASLVQKERSRRKRNESERGIKQDGGA